MPIRRLGGVVRELLTPLGRAFVLVLNEGGGSVGLVRISNRSKKPYERAAVQSHAVVELLASRTGEHPQVVLLSVGVSGALPWAFRPDLGLFTELTLTGEVSALGARGFDRLARNVSVVDQLRGLVLDREIPLHLVRYPRAVDLRQDVFLVYFDVVNGARELDETQARTSAGALDKLDQGKLLTKRGALGIKSGDDGFPTEDPAEMEIVHLIWDLALTPGPEGSVRRIVELLAERGIAARKRRIGAARVTSVLNEYGYVDGHFTAMRDREEFELREVCLTRPRTASEFERIRDLEALRKKGGRSKENVTAVPMRTVPIACAVCGGWLKVSQNPEGRTVHRRPDDALPECRGLSLSTRDVSRQVAEATVVVAEIGPERDVAWIDDRDELDERLQEIERHLSEVGEDVLSLARRMPFAEATACCAAALIHERAMLRREIDGLDFALGLDTCAGPFQSRHLLMRALRHILGPDADEEARTVAAFVLREALSLIEVAPDARVTLHGPPLTGSRFAMARSFPLRSGARILGQYAGSQLGPTAGVVSATRAVGPTRVDLLGPPPARAFGALPSAAPASRPQAPPAWSYVCGEPRICIGNEVYRLDSKRLRRWLSSTHTLSAARRLGRNRNTSER